MRAPDGIRHGYSTHAHALSLPLAGTHSALDVGSGSAEELYREGELTQTLLLLYLDNFNDIHFMFDPVSLLRQYALGSVPKVLILSMMALGVKYVMFQSPGT